MNYLFLVFVCNLFNFLSLNLVIGCHSLSYEFVLSTSIILSFTLVPSDNGNLHVLR